MAFIQVEASVRTHRKFLQAGPAASWLWLCGVGYCQDGLTDGFIPFEALPYLGVKAPERLKSKLIDAGLWVAVPGGWRIHDYLTYNKSARQIQDIKKTKRDAGKAGGIASGEARREASASTPASTPTEAPSEPPREPVSSRLVSATSPIISRRRLDAAFEGPRVWVPQRLHADFLALRRNERELFEWYQVVSDQWFDGSRKAQEPGPDMFRFWKARYDEQWPSAPPAPKTSKPAWAQRSPQA